MNAFTKKTLVSALAAAGTLGMVGGANAVNVNPDGLGNVLIYPYYTTNADPNGNAWATLLSVVNTTASAKAVKIRFREALNSQEVLDFNIFLSHEDVWTAAVTAVAGGGAQISTSDKSCTIPATVVNIPFRTANLTDGGGSSITRTAEGYVEIFEMATYTAASTTGKAVTHVNGTPPCGAAVNDTDAGAQNQPVNGGLFGTMVLVNPSSGGSFTQNATALDNFYPAGFGAYATTGSLLPNYTGADPVSNQMSGDSFYHTTWGAFGEDAVTAVLQAEQVMNEYALDPFTTSATNWVVTHPTKYLYVNGITIPPFTSLWNTKTGGACEPVVVSEWDREERNNVSQDFSPAAGGTQLCYEANVVGFSARNLFGSKTFVNVAAPFANGWAKLSFNDPGQQVTPLAANVTRLNMVTGVVTPPPVAVTYFGLPVVGFAAETFNNANATIGGVTVFASFGAEMAHRKGVSIR